MKLEAPDARGVPALLAVRVEPLLLVPQLCVPLEAVDVVPVDVVPVGVLSVGGELSRQSIPQVVVGGNGDGGGGGGAGQLLSLSRPVHLEVVVVPPLDVTTSPMLHDGLAHEFVEGRPFCC